jgi:hypothetical protein
MTEMATRISFEEMGPSAKLRTSKPIPYKTNPLYNEFRNVKRACLS